MLVFQHHIVSSAVDIFIFNDVNTWKFVELPGQHWTDGPKSLLATMLTSISTQDVLLLACNTIPYHPISKHIIHLEIDYISCFDQKKQKPIKAQAKDSV